MYLRFIRNNILNSSRDKALISESLKMNVESFFCQANHDDKAFEIVYQIIQ